MSWQSKAERDGPEPLAERLKTPFQLAASAALAAGAAGIVLATAAVGQVESVEYPSL